MGADAPWRAHEMLKPKFFLFAIAAFLAFVALGVTPEAHAQAQHDCSPWEAYSDTSQTDGWSAKLGSLRPDCNKPDGHFVHHVYYRGLNEPEFPQKLGAYASGEQAEGMYLALENVLPAGRWVCQADPSVLPKGTHGPDSLPKGWFGNKKVATITWICEGKGETPTPTPSPSPTPSPTPTLPPPCPPEGCPGETPTPSPTPEITPTPGVCLATDPGHLGVTAEWTSGDPMRGLRATFFFANNTQFHATFNDEGFSGWIPVPPETKITKVAFEKATREDGGNEWPVLVSNPKGLETIEGLVLGPCQDVTREIVFPLPAGSTPPDTGGSPAGEFAIGALILVTLMIVGWIVIRRYFD